MADELGWHLTASWADVRAKAKRIRQEGRVRILAASAMHIVGHVQGDNETYQTRLDRIPGRKATAMWECGCPWAAYSWGRRGPWRRFEGRQCSHSLATQYEAQARGMFGREIEIDTTQPHWLDPATIREPGSYDRDTGKYSMRLTSAGAEPTWPTHAGLVLKAGDTGRILMIQRSVRDPQDPAGGKWEFPGGELERHDHNSLHGAMREWAEEVGQPVPGGVLAHTWTSPNGVYQGHVMVVPTEDAVNFRDGRATVNPDDPDGDDHEQSAWWDPEHARKNPALREECKASPWKEIKMAGMGKEAAWGDPHVSPSELGDLDGPAALNGVDDDPEHALPVAYGDEHLAVLVEAALRSPAGSRTALRTFTPAEQQEMINEGADGTRARNLAGLDLDGTHYALIPDTTDDDLWGF